MSGYVHSTLRPILRYEALPRLQHIRVELEAKVEDRNLHLELAEDIRRSSDAVFERRDSVGHAVRVKLADVVKEREWFNDLTGTKSRVLTLTWVMTPLCECSKDARDQAGLYTAMYPMKFLEA